MRMYCENCGKNYANVKYTQIINGDKREMFLCEECSEVLGIKNLKLPIDFSTFLSDLFTGIEEFPQLMNPKELRCINCNSTFDDFINTGRFGCKECYSTFEEKIDLLLRNIQGGNRHIGRLGKIDKETGNRSEREQDTEREKIKETAMFGQINELNKQLKMAIKEEKYEEAARLRDKIKELEGEK